MKVRLPIFTKYDLSHFFQTGLLIMSASLLLTTVLKYAVKVPSSPVLSSSLNSDASFTQEFLSRQGLRPEQELPLKQLQELPGQIVLTFDVTPWETRDGNTPDATLLHLSETLKEQNAPSVFFLSDEWLLLYPDTVSLLAASGHNVGYLYSDGDPYERMASGKESIEKRTGQPCLFVRFSAETDHDATSLLEAACKLDLVSVSYSLDSEDWKDYKPDVLSSFIIHHPALTDGALLLFRGGSRKLAEAIPSLLFVLRRAGYEPVSLSQALQAPSK